MATKRKKAPRRAKPQPKFTAKQAQLLKRDLKNLNAAVTLLKKDLVAMGRIGLR